MKNTDIDRAPTPPSAQREASRLSQQVVGKIVQSQKYFGPTDKNISKLGKSRRTVLSRLGLSCSELPANRNFDNFDIGI